MKAVFPLLLTLTSALSLPQLRLQGILPSIMSPADDAPAPQTQPAVPLGDILGTQRSLTTFSSFSRLYESTSSLLLDLNTNTTILAPSNAAIEALPRKPWEEPETDVKAYEGEEGRKRAQENLRKLVEAHLVQMSPWEGKAKTVSGGHDGKGREVWWEEKDGKRVVMPDGVEVEKVASRVANGELWILKGVLNYV